MTAEQTRLEQALADALDIVVLTDDRAKELVARCVRALTAENPSFDEIADCLRECCSYNNSIRACATRICATLDELSRGATDMSTALTVKGIARKLRPALRVLSDPKAHSFAECVQASRAVEEITQVVSRERLLSGSLAHELRGRAFKTLSAQLLTRPDGVGRRVAAIGSSPHHCRIFTHNTTPNGHEPLGA